MTARTAVAYCCFTDKANIGDYALYTANRLLFPSFDFFYGGDARASLVNHFGGGTLYPYAITTGMFPKRRVNVGLGMGVDEPGAGERYGLLTRWHMWRWPFARMGVRGPRSAAILRLHGIDSEVTGDTALLFTAPEPRVGSGIVGINLVGEEMARSGDRSGVYEAARECGRRLLASGLKVMLIPFCEKDVAWMRRLQDDLGGEVSFLDFWSPPIDGDFDRFLRAFAACDGIITERLHAAVLAAACDMPFVSIGYKSKCLDFVSSIGMDDALFPPERLSAVSLADAAIHMLRRGNTLDEAVNARVEALRQRLRTMAGEIAALVAALPGAAKVR